MAEETTGLKVKISGDSSELKESLEAGKEALSEFGLNVEKIKEFLTGGAGLAVGLAVVAKEGLEMAIQFEAATAQMGKATGLVGEQLAGLHQSLQNVVASGVEQNFNEVAAGMTQLSIRTGATGEHLEELTKQFAEFADVNQSQMAPAIESVSKAMAKFNVDGSETEEVLDKLTLAHQKSGLSVDSLSQSLVQYGAILQQAGLDMNESLSLMVNFEKAGIDTGKAMFGLNAAIRGFVNNGEDAKSSLEELIANIKTAGSENEATALAVEHFGRSGLEMAQAIRSGSFDLAAMTKQLENAQGTLKKTADGAKSTEEAMKVLGNQVQGLAAESFQGLLNILRPGIEVLSFLIKTFESLPGPIKETAETVGLVVAGLKIAQVAVALFGAELQVSFGWISLVVGAIALMVTGFMALNKTMDENLKANDERIAALQKHAEAAKNIIGPVTDANKQEEVSEEKIKKLNELYPEFNKLLGDKARTYENIAAAAKQASDAELQGQLKSIQSQIKSNEVIQEQAKRVLQLDEARSKGTQLDKDIIARDKEDLESRSKGIEILKKQAQDLQDTIDGKVKASVKSGSDIVGASLTDLQGKIQIINQLQQSGNLSEEDALKQINSLYQARIDQITKDASKTTGLNAKQLEEIRGINILIADNTRLIDANTQAKKDNDKTDNLNKEADKLKELNDLRDKYNRDELQGKLDADKKIEESEILKAQLLGASAKDIADIQTKYANQAAQTIVNAVKNVSSAITGYISQFTGAISSLLNTMAKNESDALDRENIAAKKAAGVQEKTAVESAQDKLKAAKDALVAETDSTKEEADKQAVIEAEKALKSAQIDEETARKKADSNYKFQHAAWDLQLIGSIASAAQAVVNTMASTPFPSWPITIPLAVAAGGIQVAAVAAAEPKPPAFATGTSFAPGGPAVLGEQGAELVMSPGLYNLAKGSGVLPAKETSNILGASNKNQTFNFYSPKTLSPAETARMLKSTMRELAFQGVAAI